MDRFDQVIDVTSPALPWDDRDKVGFVKAFFLTLKIVLSHPRDFFRRLKPPESVYPPLLFFLGVQGIVMFAGLIFFLVPNYGSVNIFFNIGLVGGGYLLWKMAVVFISARVAHLLVRMFKGTSGFSTTFAAVAYSSAAGVFALIPTILAYLVPFIWGMIIAIQGLREMQKLSLGRASTACLAPVSIFIALGIGGRVLLRGVGQGENFSNRTMRAAAYIQNISRAAEKYAKAHDGVYPSAVSDLTSPGLLGETENVCGVNVAGHVYQCVFSQSGYEITATPVITGKTGEGTLTIKTGGILTPAMP